MKWDYLFSIFLLFALVSCGGGSINPNELEGYWLGIRFESNRSSENEQITIVKNWNELQGVIYVFRGGRYKALGPTQTGRAEEILYGDGRNLQQFHVEGQTLNLQKTAGGVERLDILKLSSENLRLRKDILHGEMRGSITVSLTRMDGRKLEQILESRGRSSSPQPNSQAGVWE